MMLLILFSLFIFVHGQLSVDEIFSFDSKYTSIGNCCDFQYNFTNFRIKSNDYNQLLFDCNSSSIIFQNQEQTPTSSFCFDYENSLTDFQIHFNDLPHYLIEVNQLHLHGIELCSLDELIQSKFSDNSYYRSQWALLINLKTNNKQEEYHLAIATNGEMTFILLILPSNYNTTLMKNPVELIFPNKNIFTFNPSLINVWRIDQGFVQSPKSLENWIDYQLSKTKFTLFNNETFLIYGTQLSSLRRFSVYIDERPAVCTYNYILHCTFPILPLHILDTHEPKLKLMYGYRVIFNTSLTLIPRIRLNQIPTHYSLNEIETLKVNIDENLCETDQLKSLFTLIIHIQTENMNRTTGYQDIPKNDIKPIDCKTTAEIGREIANITNLIPINDIRSVEVDLIHQWYDHSTCLAERTRIKLYL